MAEKDKEIDLTENNSSALVLTAGLFLALSWISVFLRVYTRAFLTKAFNVDDWLMVVAQSIFTTSCAFILAGVKAGIGQHNAAIPNEDDRVEALKWQALATATYVIDMMFIKLSIGFFLLRLSVQRVYQYILIVSLVVIGVWSTVMFFWDMFQCIPVAKQWDFRIQGGHCASAEAVVNAAYAISVMTILSDWLYALMPIPMLWNVSMSKNAKITVIVILGLGIFASVATLIRLGFLADLEDIGDILFAGTDAMVWTLVEPGVAIVASSLATIRPLLRAMRIRGFESADGTHDTPNSVGGSRRRSRRSLFWRRSARRTSQVIDDGNGDEEVSLRGILAGSKPRSRGAVQETSVEGRDDVKPAGGVGITITSRQGHDTDDERTTLAASSDSKSDTYVVDEAHSGVSPTSPTWSVLSPAPISTRHGQDDLIPPSLTRDRSRSGGRKIYGA